MNLTVAEISTMTEHRRLRQLESQSKLPMILWLLMISGGVITTLSACLFGTEHFKLHALQVTSLTLMLSLALVAIADIDRPFQGSVHIQPSGFERARATFAQQPADTP
jgi:ABC-type branched-subunit amino acid transport system permease subunit